MHDQHDLLYGKLYIFIILLKAVSKYQYIPTFLGSSGKQEPYRDILE